MDAIDLLLLHTAATWSLVGLIWTVQRVQYPAFALVGPSELTAFHERHSRQISWLVGPLMLGEALTGLALFQVRPAGMSDASLALGTALIAVNWAWTAFVSVPLHRRLAASAGGQEARLAVSRQLVATNWVRTVAWSLRGAWTLLALSAARGVA